MERESFENQEVADVLNKHFITIKVDREERPDVDEIYMTAVQMITRGRGGWPISLFLEPTDLQPFYGGTYFPKEDQGGRPGFISVMNMVADKWETDNEMVMKQAKLIGNAVTNQLTTRQESVPLDDKPIENGVASLLSRHDASRGGFSNAPKFPMPIYSDYLMATSWENSKVQKAVINTLDHMLMGGIYDQVGGGFHRYSTDDKWLVPHFEKMLYDNGQLVSTYATAYEKTGNPVYSRVVEDTLGYVDRELSLEAGGFLSAQDAESNHLEGETYLWRAKEIKDALSGTKHEDDLDFTLAVYGVDKGTNFQDPHHPNVPRSNVLFLVDYPKQLAAQYGMTYPEFQQKLDDINELLLAIRDTRDQPLTDDKVITAWNGMMMRGYADAGRIMNNPEWIERAEQAAIFIVNNMQSDDGKLFRTWRNGKVGANAFLIDYSAFIRGLLAIYEANQSQSILNQAKELYDKAKSLFYVNGEGWYDTEEGQSDLFVRTRVQSDGAMPAATSLILMDQTLLAKFTNNTRFLDDAMRTLESESELISKSPLAAVVATQGLHALLQTNPELFESEVENDMSEFSPVIMACKPATVSIPSGGTATVQVTLRLALGWHVNSDNPINEYAVPLEFTTMNEDIAISMTWPKGKVILSAGEQVEVFVGPTVVVPVTVTASEKASGVVSIMATWQACNEDSCLQPVTSRIPCTIIVE
jgi:hypothetical protein